MNIYETHIIPFFEKAKEGDSVLFISPSTFFGFYSLGANNFDKTCKAIEEAKERGVAVKIIIDIRDEFSAKAAEGLLSFLSQGKEIRNRKNNKKNYRIYYINKMSGAGEKLECYADDSIQSKYLPNIEVRKFLSNPKTEKITTGAVENSLEFFDQIWNSSDDNVRKCISQFLPLYRANKKLKRSITIICFLIFSLGFILGLFVVREQVFAIYSQDINLLLSTNRTMIGFYDVLVFIINIIISLFVGCLSSIAANKWGKTY